MTVLIGEKLFVLIFFKNGLDTIIGFPLKIVDTIE